MIVTLFLRWFVAAGAVLLAAYIITDISVDTFYVALVFALLLGVVNVTIKPLLVLLTLPINLITLGLFTFVINGLLFWWLGSVVQGIDVGNFWSALLGSLIVSVIMWLSHALIRS